MKSFMRLRQRSKVLLPQPDGPIMEVILFFAILNETFFTARLPEYATLTLSILRISSPMFEVVSIFSSRAFTVIFSPFCSV